MRRNRDAPSQADASVRLASPASLVWIAQAKRHAPREGLHQKGVVMDATQVKQAEQAEDLEAGISPAGMIVCGWPLVVGASGGGLVGGALGGAATAVMIPRTKTTITSSTRVNPDGA